MPPVTISSPLAPPPQQYTNARTLIAGQYKEAGLLLLRNGLLLTPGADYARQGGRVILTVPPVKDDTLTARVFAIGRQLGGTSPERFTAPWSLPLTGAFDGIATDYRIEFGPTIFGICDGRNPQFVWGVQVGRARIFRNGVLQTVGVDCAVGPTKVVFFPAAVPQPGDLISVEGF